MYQKFYSKNNMVAFFGPLYSFEVSVANICFSYVSKHLIDVVLSESMFDDSMSLLHDTEVNTHVHI